MGCGISLLYFGLFLYYMYIVGVCGGVGLGAAVGKGGRSIQDTYFGGDGWVSLWDIVH